MIVKKICVFFVNQHKEHNTINFNNLFDENDQNEEFIEKIQKVNELVDGIIDYHKHFKNNLDVYVGINEKLKENLLNMNLNYENLKNMKNLMEISFLKKDIDQILNINDINERIQKIISMYGMMVDKTTNVNIFIMMIKLMKLKSQII